MFGSAFLRVWLCILTLCCAPVLVAAQETPPRPETFYRAEQDAAVSDARKGDVPAGLAVLERLYQQHPDDQWLLGDYLFLLQWNKDNAKAVEYSGRLNLAAAPPYAVEAGARALAATGKFYDCEKLLERALTAQQRNPELLVTAAFVFSDIGDVYKAALLIEEAERSRTPGLGHRIAAVREGMGYERIMAMRGFHEAVKPDARAVALEKVLWGEQSAIPRNLAERESNLRASLALLDSLDADPQCRARADCLLQRDVDRIRPLADLGMAEEAAAQYEAVKDRVPLLPPSAQLAAANAYMSLRKPDKAREIYAAIVALQDKFVPPLTQDDLYRARNGLFWAYLESEQLPEALQQAEFTWESVDHPTGGEPYVEDTDWKKLDAETTLGYAYLYTDSFGQAEKFFKEITDKAPASNDAQSGLAATYLMRGLPRTALEAVHRAQIFSPDDINLAAHEANALMDVKDWRAAKQIIDDLKDYAPYSSEVRLLQRRWETHTLFEFQLKGNWASTMGNTSPGTNRPEQMPSLEWRLYSPPLGYDWRLYGGSYFARDRYDEGLARQFLSLAGVEYRVPWVTANLELRYDDAGSDDLGAALYGTVTPDDHWSFPFAFELGSRDTPLRARNEGITSDSYSIGGSYDWNESRSAWINAAGMSFSDGNQRLGLDAGFTQRLWHEFTHYVDGTVSVYGGGNSKDEDRPYFNPRAEAEIDGSLTYGAVLWRRYDTSLSHAVTAGAGGYAQRNYGVLPVFSLEYSQELDFNDRISAAYGLGVERRPYDGDQENDINVFINLNWKF